MQYESKHTLHIKTTCVNTPFISAYHSVWACQPMQLDAFWEEGKIIIQNRVPCSIRVKKKGCLLWVRFCLSMIHNKSQLKSFWSHLWDLWEETGKGKKVGHKSHGNPSLQRSLLLNHLLASLAVVAPTSTCCSMQHAHTHARTHTYTHTHTHTQRLWASICMLRSCANTDQTILIGPCLWHSSGCLYCNFLPALIHVLSTVIPAGLWDAFIMQRTSTEAVGEMQRRHVVFLLSSHIVLSSHAIMNAAVCCYP